MPEEPTATEQPIVHAERKYRLTDTQALAALASWLIFRTITQRLAIAFAPKLIGHYAWTIPLLNDSGLLLIQAGTGTTGHPAMFFATVLSSIFLSMVAGMVLYWAGWRFGPKLETMAQRPGSPWAGLWNPKQIARAERWMNRWGVPVVFVFKIIDYFYVPVVLVAAVSEMRFRKFFIANFLGSIGYGCGYLYIGAVAQKRWPGLRPWLEHTYGPWALRIGLGLLVLLVLMLVLGQLLDKKVKAKEEAEADQRSTTTPSQPESESPPENS